MSLFDETGRVLGLRKGDRAIEIKDCGALLAETQSQLRDFELRLLNVERAVDQFASAFEKKLSELTARGREAKS